MDDLVRKLRSQIGDDVQEIYSHEALFKLAAARIEELEAAADYQDGIWRFWNKKAHEQTAKYLAEHARAERAKALLKEAMEALRMSLDNTAVSVSDVTDDALRDTLARLEAAQEGKG